MRVSGKVARKQFHAGGTPPIIPRLMPVTNPRISIDELKSKINTPIEKGNARPSNHTIEIKNAQKDPINPVTHDSWVKLRRIACLLNPIACMAPNS